MQLKWWLAALFITVTANTSSAQDQMSIRPIVGELRVLSVSTQSAVDRLHRAGWLEAEGQVVSRAEFPELFATIGRSWTADAVSSDWFAVPLVAPGALRAVTSSDNPYGVLGPGDLITSGRRRPNRQGPLSYWIYVGRSIAGPDVKGPTR